MIWRSVVLLLGTWLVGCTTYRSTFLNRQEGGDFRTDSHCGTTGVPVAVKVPTHLDLFIEERYYLLPHDDLYREVEIAGPDGRPLVNRGLRSELVETKKVFLVDFKRAAAGVSQSGLKFNADQGLAEVSGKIQDETLRDATAAVGALGPLLTANKSSAGTTTALESKGLVAGARVVAYRRFDLDAPDFEQQVADFVACHLEATASPIAPESPTDTPTASPPPPASPPDNLSRVLPWRVAH